MTGTAAEAPGTTTSIHLPMVSSGTAATVAGRNAAAEAWPDGAEAASWALGF